MYIHMHAHTHMQASIHITYTCFLICIRTHKYTHTQKHIHNHTHSVFLHELIFYQNQKRTVIVHSYQVYVLQETKSRSKTHTTANKTESSLQDNNLMFDHLINYFMLCLITYCCHAPKRNNSVCNFIKTQRAFIIFNYESTTCYINYCQS